MEIFTKIVLTILLSPFALVGGLIYGLLCLLVYPFYILVISLEDIWG